MCCTQLARNTGRKNDAKNRHLRTIAQLCRAISSQLRHISTIRKNLLNSNMSSTCPYNMANFGPLVAQIGSGVWGSPANFNGFRVLAALLHGTLHSESKKGCHPNHGYNFVNSWWICKILSLLQRAVNF